MNKTIFRTLVCIGLLITGIGAIPACILFYVWMQEDQNEIQTKRYQQLMNRRN